MKGKPLLNPFEIIIFLLVLVFFLANFKYLAYPDEFVNLLGGVALNQGKLPYRDFFDHHVPFAWYFGALLLRLSSNNFVTFRLLFTLFTFISLFALALHIKKNFKDIYPYYLLFFALYPLLSLYFWIHLYVADSLAALFFAVTFWLLLTESLKEKGDFKNIAVASFSTFFMVFSSLTFLYLGGALYIWQLYLLLKQKRKIMKLLFLMIFISMPYLLYFLYLLMTKTLDDFLFSNITYNTELYISIPNYTRGRLFNPFKFALTLLYNFFAGYVPLLTRVKHFDLYAPIDVLSGLGTLFLLFFLARKRIFLGIIFFFVLSFSVPRSTIGTINEANYQAALFIVLGVASTATVLYFMKKEPVKDRLLQDLSRFANIILIIFLLFSSLFLLVNTYNKYFERYTQKMPSIRNIGDSAVFLDGFLTKDDFFWIGPFEPHEAFFVKNARLAGKYPTLLPQFRENEYLKNDFIKQFEKNKPKIIIFKHEASIFQTPSEEFGAFFLDWLKQDYTQLEMVKGITYLKSPSSFTLRTDLYMRNRDKESLLTALQKQGYIEMK